MVLRAELVHLHMVLRRAIGVGKLNNSKGTADTSSKDMDISKEVMVNRAMVRAFPSMRFVLW